MKKDRENQVMETELVHLLEEGNMGATSPEDEAVNQLIPPYESRVKAEKDPIKEETKIVQQYVKETNKKYLRYLEE